MAQGLSGRRLYAWTPATERSARCSEMMKQHPWSVRLGLAAAAASLVISYPAAAQIEPGLPLSDQPLPVPPKVTSTEAAQTATAAEQRDARKLATAVFAKPAAAARAAEKVDAANQPDLSKIEPKPEWSVPAGPQISGKGLQIKTPF
jgi:hypothetical protein